ncbi:MAG: glycosyltransferase [Cyanobacteria bacterium J06621_15]
MTISVIVPVFNAKKTIKETIYSILNQTFKDIEVIVSDDCSTDSTLEIVKSISDSRIKVISNPTNTGVSETRNRGIAQAQGEYISFIDADDLWTPDKLESQWQVLQNNPQAAVAYSWTDYINAEGKFIKSGRRVIANGDIFTKLLQINFLENGSNPLIRHKALAEIGGFDKSLVAAEDKDMWLRLAANYEFVCVEKPQILYRQSKNSLSTNLKTMEDTSLKVIERAFKYAKAEKFQHLKRQTISQMYQYLTFKAIEVPIEKRQPLTATYFLWNYMKNNSNLLTNKKLIAIAAFKILLPQLSQKITKRKKHNLNK